MSLGGALFILFVLLMALVEGQLWTLLLGCALALMVCYVTSTQLDACVANICDDVERIMRCEVLKIENKELRRKAERTLEQDLQHLHNVHSEDNWGIRQLSYILGLAILAWPLLGVVALAAIFVSSPAIRKANVKKIVTRMREVIRTITESEEVGPEAVTN